MSTIDNGLWDICKNVWTTEQNSGNWIARKKRTQQEFVLVPEIMITLELWYQRYEDRFFLDGRKLDYSSRVRFYLVMQIPMRYIQTLFHQYIQRYWFWTILISEKKLERNLVFSIYYKCLLLDKYESDNFLTCASIVNKHFETLNNLFTWNALCLLLFIALSLLYIFIIEII